MSFRSPLSERARSILLPLGLSRKKLMMPLADCVGDSKNGAKPVSFSALVVTVPTDIILISPACTLSLMVGKAPSTDATS